MKFLGLGCVVMPPALMASLATFTSNILMSLVIDKFGMFGMETHALSAGRMAGAVLMVAGVAMVSYL